MNKNFSFLGMILSSIVGAIIALVAYNSLWSNKNYEGISYKQNFVLSNYDDTTNVVVPEGLNFVNAADRVRPAVVHIKTLYEAKQSNQRQQVDPFFRQFFGDDFDQYHGEGGGNQPKEAAGSGVILTEDGYIVTNNHVIDKADKIKVILDDKRSYEAKLIGVDPSTDLALLKIEEKNLAFVPFGNSDHVRVGEWVLAVGNPFDLTSTVTAGIVSAKGRNINILRSKTNYAIESFIQTDAAVNPGNSGGALVDLKGRLIGINTAIATPTGSYTGYSFAVPEAIVKKVVDDLLKYGEVQRGLLGINIQDISAELAKEKGLKDVKGVYVGGVNENGAAKEAGIMEGDVITKINDVNVNTSSELQENVARYRPGNKINVTFLRKGVEKTVSAVLKNKMGNLSIVKAEDNSFTALGAEFKALTKEDKQKFKVEEGVKVTKLKEGKLKDAGMKEGFIITKVDKQPIQGPEELIAILNSRRNGGVLLEGIYADGKKGYIGFGWE